MQADGYSLDDKRNKIDKSDIPDIIEQYKNRNSKAETDRKNKFFFVPKAEIVENEYDLSISKYKEEVYEEVVYEASKVIIDRLEEIQRKINIGLSELKEII